MRINKIFGILILVLLAALQFSALASQQISNLQTLQKPIDEIETLNQLKQFFDAILQNLSDQDISSSEQKSHQYEDDDAQIGKLEVTIELLDELETSQAKQKTSEEFNDDLNGEENTPLSNRRSFIIPSKVKSSENLPLQLVYTWSLQKETQFWEWFNAQQYGITKNNQSQSFGLDQALAVILEENSYYNNLTESFKIKVKLTTQDNITVTQIDHFNASNLRQLSGDCGQGYFRNSSKKCAPCPTGCYDCSQANKCSKCEKGWTMISGKDFGYCFPDCPTGYYIQTRYTDENAFFGKSKSSSKRSSDANPVIMISQCEPCPWGCGGCIYDEKALRPICYDCMKGFMFNQTTGECDIIPCKDGEFRPKPLNQSVSISIEFSYDEYLCQPCEEGCQQCSNWTNCQTCYDGYAIFSRKGMSTKGCMGCPAFCQKCTVTSKNVTQCQTCQEKFFLNKTKECELNRTCSIGQWFNDSSLNCEPCPSNCPTCKQGEKNGTIVCTSCTNDSYLDNTTQLCKDRCDFTQAFYVQQNNSCVTCPSTSYPDQSSLSCKTCPNYCKNCYWNKTKTRVECSQCTDDSYFENSTTRCKVDCNDTAYFDYTSSQCTNCPAGTFLNKTTQSCQVCPTNCSTCFFNNTSQKVECQSCSGDNVVDYLEKRCRRPCNSTLFYNWTSGSCSSCPAGTVINETIQVCENCPRGCTSCFNNKTSQRVECDKCTVGMIIDPEVKQCRYQCSSTNTFYWDVFQCRVCPPYQHKNQTSKQCEDCPFGCIDCYTSNKNLYCSTCNSTTIIDHSRWQCKLDCKNQTIFNWETFSCEPCPSRQYYHENAKACRDCGSNCLKCSQINWYNSSTECQVCDEGYVVDISKKTCIPECPLNQYWSAGSKKCVSCPSTQFYNQATQKCEGCPSNCLSCFRDSKLNQVNCTSCRTGVLDIKMQKCRVDCNSQSYYNWTTNQCTPCGSENFYNKTSQECQSCPRNCTSCTYNQSLKRIECNGCKNNWIFDNDYKLCKPECNESQIYDFDLEQCRNCPVGQYLNSKKTCEKCPVYCTSCDLNSKGILQCETCDANSYIDPSRQLCRNYCNETAYYDWSKNNCINCKSDQYLNQTTEKCTTCPTNCQTCVYSNSTGAVSCTACKSNYVLDHQRKECRRQCNSTSYFDWDTNSCKRCDIGHFLHPDSQQCQPCPKGCTNCAFVSSSQSVQCSDCLDSYILDNDKQLCREICNATAYYNWVYQECQNCASDQYVNQTTQTCQNCPANCTKCKVNNDNTIECTGCTANNVIDSNTKQCRIQCDSNSYYNYTTMKCIQCAVGQWKNQSSQQCQSCPQGCYQCFANSSNLPECTSCIQGMTYDSKQKRCRKNCNTGQYFDWTAFNCYNCSSGCQTCINSQQCTGCNEQYNLIDNVCVEKCTPGQQVWNSNTKKCDDIAKPGIKLTPQTINMIKCRSYDVSITEFSGFTNLQIAKITWSYSHNQTVSRQWQQEFDQIIQIANQNNAQSITLSKTLTEATNQQVNVTVTATVESTNGQLATNSTKFVIWPYAETTITNYQQSYTIDANEGLTLNPKFSYPECVNSGPVNIPFHVNIGCKLYDEDSNYIKDLDQCSIQPNEIINGNSYLIKYYYIPHEYQQALRDTITINTIVQQSSCSIDYPDVIVVKSNEAIQLDVNVVNKKITYVYRWHCYPVSSTGVCGIQQTTQNSANLNIPASGFTPNEHYTFVLTIQDNRVELTSCSAIVEVVESGEQLLTLSLVGLSAKNQGYLDTSVNNNFICQQNETDNDNLNYNIRIQSKSNNKPLTLSGEDKGIVVNQNALQISKNSLMKNSEYEVICEAKNNKYSGIVTQSFNTYENLDINLDFTISPNAGTEYKTLYKLSVDKPQNVNLWCNFGYLLQNNQIEYIFQQEAVTYSSNAQSVTTTLKRSVQSGSVQTMIVRCQNEYGQYVDKTANVTVKKGTGNKLDSILGLNRFIQNDKVTYEDIQTSFQQYSQQLSNDLPYEDKIEFQMSILEQIERIAHRFTQQQLQVIISIVTEIWNEIKDDQEENPNKGLILQTINSCISLLDQEIMGNQLAAFDEDHYLTVISIFDEVLSNYKNVFYNNQVTIDKLIKSISSGALRTSANMIPDKDRFTAQGNFFVVSVEKQSRKSLSDGSDTKNLTLQNDVKGVSISIPQNLILSQYDYVIITTLVFKKGLQKYNDDQRIMSDTIWVDAYFSSSPIAIEGKYEIHEVVIKDLVDPIILQIPFKPNSDSDIKEQMKCAYFSEIKEQWQLLECNARDFSGEFISDDDVITCCTRHLTTFAIVYDKYFQELLEQAFRQILYSILPPAFIYVILGISIIMTLIQARKLRKLREQKDKQKQSSIPKVDSECIQSSTRQQISTNNILPPFEVNKNGKNLTNRELKMDTSNINDRSVIDRHQVESNYTQNDISPNQEFVIERSIDVNEIEVENKPEKKKESDRCKAIKESSKIYKLFCEQLKDDSHVFQSIFEKIMICNVLLLSFTTTIIIAYNVIIIYINSILQAKDIGIIIVASYTVLLMLTILFKQLEGVVKNGSAIKHIWFALHLIFAFAQPIFITQIADDLNKVHFVNWLVTSAVILAISCTVEDLIFVPLFHSLSKAIKKKLNL